MRQLNKSRVFITGSSGFIGANIVRELLRNKYDVHILNRSRKLSWRLKGIENLITIHNEDITNFLRLKKALSKINPDYIIHLAAYGAYHYQNELEKIVHVNIEGTKNLLEASKNIPYKCFINTGTSSEYGFKDESMKETDFCNPISYYAATKLAATNICKIFAQINNKPIVTFRLFSVYGPYEEHTRFIPTIMKSLIQKKEILLTPGNQRRDFIYTGDVAEAYIRALTLGKKIQGEICNIGTGKEYTNDKIVKLLFAVTGNKTEIKKGAYPKRAWDTSHWKADTSHAKKILGWEPRHTINQGLSTTYSWFKNNIKLYS